MIVRAIVDTRANKNDDVPLQTAREKTTLYATTTSENVLVVSTTRYTMYTNVIGLTTMSMFNPMTVLRWEKYERHDVS